MVQGQLISELKEKKIIDGKENMFNICLNL